jgi:hypothetical protein
MTAHANMLLLPVVLVLQPGQAWSFSNDISRRTWATNILQGSLVVISSPDVTMAQSTVDSSEELPMMWRDFAKLAPLGKVESMGAKTTNLPLSELAQRLQQGLLYGSTGQGGYILSGDFPTDLFRDDCVFIDPSNRVASLSQCQKALRILFDPKRSSIELLEPLTVQEADHTITGRFRLRGVLQFPWNPYITAYESTIVYTIAEDGLVAQQTQTWTKSANKALQESFTPTLFTPPPLCTLPPSPTEPSAVTSLMRRVNGRRPYEYSAQERQEIESLIQTIIRENKGRFVTTSSDALVGSWMLVYLEPGPTGTGVDRRVPFPELPFNNQFQVFTPTTVTNVGELWGPYLDVRVSGSWHASLDVKEESNVYVADIDGGQICVNRGAWCGGSLPIQGQGLFTLPYVGERLRILQNINGGGARGVQIRVSQA